MNRTEITPDAESADFETPLSVPLHSPDPANDYWTAHFQRLADQIADLNERLAVLENEE